MVMVTADDGKSDNDAITGNNDGDVSRGADDGMNGGRNGVEGWWMMMGDGDGCNG